MRDEITEFMQRRLEVLREIDLRRGTDKWYEPMDRRGHYEFGTHFVPSAGISENGVLMGYKRGVVQR